MSIQEATIEIASPIVAQAAKRLRKRAKAADADVLLSDRVLELKRLVRAHARLKTIIQILESAVRDRTMTMRKQPNGEWSKLPKSEHYVMPAVVSEVYRSDVLRAVDPLKANLKDLVKAMVAQLRHVPIHEEFLRKVYGCGDGVLSAYLVSMVDIHKCPNVSNLIRYCGNAPDPTTGRREVRRDKPKSIGGEFGTFNDELRQNNFEIMLSMRKNAARTDEDKPFGSTTKYLDRWYEALHFRRTTGREKGAFHAGRMKATDLFLWDLYVMWRTIEGLDLRHDKYTVQRGFDHAGNAVDLDVRFRLTMDQAREMVGHVGASALATTRVWGKEAEVEE